MSLRDNDTSLPAPKPMTRRRFLMQNLALLTTAYFGEEFGERNLIQTSFHRVPVANLKEPLRITQVSDLHRSWCVSDHFVGRCIDLALKTKPDLYLFTGDFVTGRADYSESCAAHIQRLEAPLGKFAVLGNHDIGCNLGGGASEVIYNVAQADVRMLTNRSFVLDNGFQIVGIDDAAAGHPNCDAAFGKVEWNRPVIAMTHNPVLFKTHLHRYPCLTLTGHTHGGQVNIPGLTPLFMQTRKTHRNIPDRYKRGWVSEPDAPGKMYVSRGLGVVELPFRFRSQPEIAVFDLIPA